MQKVSGTMIRGILFVILVVGSFVVRARAGAILCEECYSPFGGGDAYCEDKENGRIKHGTCKGKDKITCTGLPCGGEEEEPEEQEFDAIEE